MADDRKKKLTQQGAEEAQETEGRELHLGHGRTLRTSTQGTDDVLEIRAASGDLELSVVLTETGPVMRLEGVRLQVDCKTFEVNASEGMKLATGGELEVSSEKDTRITSPAEVFVKGKMIWLN